jgi:UDP-N-acetylmuramyl pentapeptide phosphotransferase/UDP-N-acetylglucosamine-1-phosphate transferase
MTERLLIVIAFIFSIVCGFIFIPMILNFCKEKRLYDIPNSRKMHHNKVPRLGGISFLPSMLIAFLLTTFVINPFTGYEEVNLSLWSLYFLVSLMLIYGVGFIDDLIGLDARTKFLVQIIAASLLPMSGLYLNDLYGFLGIHEIPYVVGAPLTVFVIVFINNAINLIDGIDGLSACLSFIALTGFLICFIREDIYPYAILIAGLMGVIVPFLYFNLLGKAENNRKIFMGDSGSLTLGFILGFLTVKLSMDNPNVMPLKDDNRLLIAYSLLIVPMFDVVRVSLIRLRHHTPIFQADKNHIHHKLIRTGQNQHQALISILLLALLYIGMNLLLLGVTSSTIIVAIDILLWIGFHALLNRAILKNGKAVFLNPQNNE